MVNMDKLLKKKGWTGEELGRLAIANFMLGFKKVAESGNPDEELPIKRSELSKMLDTLKEPSEWRVYNNYMNLHTWVTKTMALAMAQEQQAQLQYTTLVNYLTNAISAEDVYNYIEELPLIMTEKEYKDTKDRRIEEILNPEGGAETNVLQLVIDVIEHYVRLLDKSPQAKNPLKPLKKKLEKELVTDPHILDRYNEVMGQGYYTLEDGTRSDSVTPTEWRALVSPLIDKFIKLSEIGEKEALYIKLQILKKKELDDVSSLLFKGTLEEEDRRKANEETKGELFKKCEWHYYEDSPTDLTKWEMIISGNLSEYYDGFCVYDNATDKQLVELAIAFTKEFPDVTKAILEDIAKKYPDLKYIKDLPVEEWLDLENCPTWETLYKLDFYDFKETYLSNTSIFEGNRRAIQNGVAILQPSVSNEHIDKETGYYIAPDIRKTLADFSLEGFFTEREDYAKKVEEIEEARELFISSVYYIRGFNKCLDMISDMYGVEEVKIAQGHLEYFEEKTEAFNQLISYLYKRIADTDYEDTELKEKKLGVLKDIFYPIDIKKTTLPRKRIKKAKDAIKDFKGFNDDRYNPSNLLCAYDPRAVEEELELEEEERAKHE